MRKNIRKSLAAKAAVCLIAAGIISGCSFAESDSDSIIKAMTENHPEAIVTVGIWDNGKTEYHVYGENGKILPTEQHNYAIGSLTKTFAGAYIAKLEHEGKLIIENRISELVSAGKTQLDPTLKQLLTHTSGLSDEWERLLEQEPNTALTRENILAVLKDKAPDSKEEQPYYSNFGSALAATAAAAVEGKTGKEAISGFIKNDLRLDDTDFDNIEQLTEFFTWQEQDEMALSGGLISNAKDMLGYGRLYLGDELPYLQKAASPLKNFSDDYDCGYFWLIDDENDIVWHNGELCFEDENSENIGHQSFIGFSKSRNKVIVVLSNVIAYDSEETALSDLLGYSLMLGE